MPQPAVYYIAYSHTRGFGAMDITVPQPIRTAADIWAISNEVQLRYPGAVVLNYQLINQPTPVDPATIAGLVDHAQRALSAGATPKTILTRLLTELNKISH